MEMEKLKAVMFVGTSSDVGKSVLTAGFCRILKQDGFHPAPFKAQNMSLNSYATPEGLEIGRAQAVQAEAAGIPCHTDMNPVLLKPTTDKSSQVILNGKPAGNQTAKEYFMSGDRAALFKEVVLAYDRLAARYNPIVLEGAGSISELNLKARDITNMRMAMKAGAATYLVTDIDRGGIFGSLYGTIQLLEPAERVCIKGIIVNKFRGDADLFTEGKRIIEDLCGVPVLGIIPYFKDITIEEEDALSLKSKRNSPVQGKVNIAVVLVGKMSNFTDFDRLEHDQRVNLYYTHNQEGINGADIVILPGSKNTIEDLLALKNAGLAAAIVNAYKNGKTVIGICGGYQMLGETLSDPMQVESAIGAVHGLGILPVETVLTESKTTRQVRFQFKGKGALCRGYEIHMGRTTALQGDKPLAVFYDAETDGYLLNDKCWGTYIHGILDNEAVINDLLAPFTGEGEQLSDYQDYKEEQYNKLADLIRANVNMDLFYQQIRYQC
jgi:adenosylcobyric acid synthase